MKNFQTYLSALRSPFKKLAKLEFLQPDNSVAFTLDNNYKRGYTSRYDSRAFVQAGSLSVSLQNGIRRKATVTLSNLDGAFDYSVNKIWFGKRVRLSMGMILPNGQEFYLPQGVFYITNPQKEVSGNLRQMTYSLVDKWAYLDGSLFGKLPFSFEVASGSNIFSSMRSVLKLSTKNLKSATNDPFEMVDSTEPVFTSYYDSLPSYSYTYTTSSGNEVTRTVKPTQTPFQTIVEAGKNLSDIILDLNKGIVGIVGYDPTGAFRVEPSQDDILDVDKPILWNFTPENSELLGYVEVCKDTDVYNDIIIAGEGLNDEPVYGRATNYDPRSDTNVNLIGLKTHFERRADYNNAQQCIDYASWVLKRKTILQKSISIRSSQMFHLMENRLVSIKRTDKEGSPTEKHLIQSFTLPIGETGEMSINACSVNDYQIATTTSSDITT